MDIDGCLYDLDKDTCGFYQNIGNSIQAVFNNIVSNYKKGPQVQKRAELLLEEKGFHYKGSAIDCRIRPEVFVPIIQAVSDIYPAEKFKHLNIMYGDNYKRIKPQIKIASAFRLAKAKGINIFFYTSGPSCEKENTDSHTQKIMHLNGFNRKEIEFYRHRTYDLLRAIDFGCGKPTRESMKDFLSLFKINPKESVMFDDGIKNLHTAANFGITPIWTFTADQEPVKADINIAKEIKASRVRNTAQALMKIAKMA